MTQRVIRRPNEIHLGLTGPPSSALPKNAKFLLSMRIAMAQMAQMVKSVTLKPRAGSSTRKGVPWKDSYGNEDVN